MRWGPRLSSLAQKQRQEANTVLAEQRRGNWMFRRFFPELLWLITGEKEVGNLRVSHGQAQFYL